jgi:CheY-like chemotaxis protein
MFDPDFASRLPFRILVVEDNPVNQKLALLLLSRMGYRADTANNGLEAIRALRRQRYDVVFMDMHMPEMDGVEASRQIQDLWKEDERPWIIALTANAMPSDRELCKRAGMHDFLTKPIQGADLQAALLNVPQRPGKGADIPSPYPGEVEWEVPEYLADLAKEDPETCRELIGLFCADGEKSVDALEIALTAGDETAVRRHLHTLKGSSAQMGASAMAALCADMEEKLKGGPLVDIAARMPALKARLEAVRVITGEYLEQLSARPEPGGMLAL